MYRYLEVKENGNPIYRIRIDEMSLAEARQERISIQNKYKHNRFTIASISSPTQLMEIHEAKKSSDEE